VIIVKMIATRTVVLSIAIEQCTLKMLSKEARS